MKSENRRLRGLIGGTSLVLLAAGAMLLVRGTAPRGSAVQPEYHSSPSASRDRWSGFGRWPADEGTERGSLRIVSPAPGDVLRGSREIVVLAAEGQPPVSIHVSLDGKRVSSGVTPVRWLLDPGAENLANGEHVLAAWSSSADGPAPGEVRFRVDISHGFAVREVVPAAAGPGTRLTINGSGFGPGVKVRVGGALASVELATTTTLRVRTPDRFATDGGGVVVERDGQLVEAAFQRLAPYRPPSGSAQPPANPAGAVAMKLVEGTQAYASGGVLASRGLDDVGSLSALIAQVGGMGVVDEDAGDSGYRAVHDAAEQASGEQMFDMSQLFVVPVAEGVSPERVAEALSTHPLVELAYVLPRSSDRLAGDISPPTCQLKGFQNHLEPSNYDRAHSTHRLDSRGGMDVLPTWELWDKARHGIRGQSATIVDVEFGWYTDHEDLSSLSMLSYLNSPYPELGKLHGTAVAGLLVADDDDHGVVGIVPEATLLLYNAASDGPLVPGCTMLRRIVSLVPAPAIILIELQTDQGTPWEDPRIEVTRQACIRQLTLSGYVFVEPAGNGTTNGANDLDALKYPGTQDPAFAAPTSGAIIVGAAEGPEHVRKAGTSGGSRVDLHGWGADVATTGYCDAFAVVPGSVLAPTCPSDSTSPPVCDDKTVDLRQAYTRTFGDTSAAAAQVAGAVAAVLSLDEDLNVHRYDADASCSDAGACTTAAHVRNDLVRSGTPSSPDADMPQIGPMPDLGATICNLMDGLECQDAIECGDQDAAGLKHGKAEMRWSGCACTVSSECKCDADPNAPCKAEDCGEDLRGKQYYYYSSSCACEPQGGCVMPEDPVEEGCTDGGYCPIDVRVVCECSGNCRVHREAYCMDGRCVTRCIAD